MLVLGLVHDARWEPPDDDEQPRRPRAWRLPWRPLAWLAVWCWMLVLAGIAANAFGALVGYLIVLLAVALGSWRVERWCARQYWGGLREWHG